MILELTHDEKNTLVDILHAAAEMFTSRAKICREPGALTGKPYEATARSFEDRAVTATWLASHIEKMADNTYGRCQAQ